MCVLLSFLLFFSFSFSVWYKSLDWLICSFFLFKKKKKKKTSSAQKAVRACFFFPHLIYLRWLNFCRHLTDSLQMDYPFQIACVQPLPPLRKKSEKGCLWGRGRPCTGQSQTDNPFLALVWKRPITKFPCPVFLMIAKDCTERLSAVALSIGLITPHG